MSEFPPTLADNAWRWLRGDARRTPLMTPPADYWSQPVEVVLSELETTLGGLSRDESARRLAMAGPNVPVPRRRKGSVRILASRFASPMSALLLAAAVLSIALGEGIDGTLILGILLVSGVLGYWQEQRASTAVEELLALVRTTTIVLRDGSRSEIPVEHVVIGDVVVLAAGAGVPADARLLTANDLYVDQSTLTGESFHRRRSQA